MWCFALLRLLAGPPRGPIYSDEMAERCRISTVRHALQDMADAMGDVDPFIEAGSALYHRFLKRIVARVAVTALLQRRYTLRDNVRECADEA